MNNLFREVALFATSILALAGPVGAVPQVSSDRAAIKIDANTIEAPISPLLIGSNILVSRNAWGLWDEKTQTISTELTALTKELGLKVMRYPGGGHAEAYHWRNGVGPQQHRPDARDQWGWVSNYYFGTDEFLLFCERIGCSEKVITVNFTTGSPQEAANWVEYCNGSVPASPDPTWTENKYKGDEAAPPGYFAWLRAKYGHPKPYEVRYWEIGNELYLTPPSVPVEVYAKSLKNFAKKMKAKDPTILIGACAPNQDGGKWTRHLASTAGKEINFLCPHYYDTFPLPLRLTFHSNARYTTSFNVEKEGHYTLAVVARGSACGGVWPDMEVCIDERVCKVFSVQSELFKEYVHKIHLTAGDHPITITFTNDKADKDGDRNLFLSSLRIGADGKYGYNLLFDDEAENRLLASDSSKTASLLRTLVKDSASGGPKLVAVTEGNWGNGTDESRSFTSALWVAGLINTLAREQAHMFCQWWLIDTGSWGLLRRNGRTTPMFEVMKLYSRFLGSKLIKSELIMDDVALPRVKPHEDPNAKCKMLDAIATADNSGNINVIVINWSSDRSTLVDLSLAPAKISSVASAWTMEVANRQPGSSGGVGSSVPIKASVVSQDGRCSHTLPPASLTVIQFQKAK